MRIAIAEASGAVGQILRASLAFGDDDIVEIAPGEDAQSVLSLVDPRVLILDWSPHGPALTGACRQTRPGVAIQPYIFVVALTDPADPTARQAAFAAGVDSVVAKPITPDEILTKIDVARRIVSHEDSLRIHSQQLEHIRLDLEMANAMLSEIASCDALTGLRNRRYFCETLDAQFSLARRKGLPMSLVMVDVDQFKAFNDRYGHLAGDEVLRSVGHLLRESVRDHDVVARYGGEEFAILLPATDDDESLPLVDRLRLTIADHPWPLRRVTISLGIATLGPGVNQPSDLLDQADRSLYYSKAMGRNRATHARELSELNGTVHPTRLSKDPLFSSPGADSSFQIATNAASPHG